MNICIFTVFIFEKKYSMNICIFTVFIFVLHVYTI